MSNYLQPMLAWMNVTSLSLPLLLSAIPLVLLAAQMRVVSALALAGLAGCAAALHYGANDTTAVVLALTASASLGVIDGFVARRDMRRLGRQLVEVSKTMRALQTSEERRQAFVARKLLPNWSPPIEEKLGAIRSAERSNGHLAEGFTHVS